MLFFPRCGNVCWVTKMVDNTEEKKGKQQNKFILALKHIKESFISLHHIVWGRGWKRFFIAAGVSFVGITAFMILSLEITSQPRFCNSCHNMRPYYQSWKTSSHREVTCTDCHFPPGFESKIRGKFTALSMLVNYFTGVYKRGKPWAEISDLSCMRSGCHESRLLTGQVKFKENILFDHAPHLTGMRRGKKLRCTSCHSQIVQGSHISVTESSCFLCHFKEEAASDTPLNHCTKCHRAPEASEGKTAAEAGIAYDHRLVNQRNIECGSCHGTMLVGDGSVPKNRCHVCHAEAEKIRLYKDSELMHLNHITDHKIECQQCHTPIQHKSVSRTADIKPDCRACHPDFHNAQLLLFSGKSGRGIPERPDTMFEAGLNCKACHRHQRLAGGFKEYGETHFAMGSTCDQCHGDGYARILEDWKHQCQRRLGQLDRVLGAAEREVNNKKGTPGFEAARKMLTDARYNFKLVKYGRSVHNITYANRLMDESYRLAVESLKQTRSTGRLPDFDRSTRFIPGQCSNCHAGFERTPIKVFGWRFSHRLHLEKQELQCNQCHAHEPRHGNLIIQKQDCMSCHHRDKSEKGCADCHQTQYSIYFSKLSFSTLDIPNPMSEGVGCVDCHKDERENIIRPGKKSCTNCHESEYEDMFDEWQESGNDLLKKLNEKIKSENLKPGAPAYNMLIMLEKDGSKGVHNPELYDKLAEEALNH